MDTDNTPLIPAEAAAPAPSRPPAPPAEPWTVLCVDDEPSILSALKRVLRAEDCKVLQAGGGAEAFALVAEADATGTSPGKDVLRDLLERHSPCVVLIAVVVASFHK